METQTIWEILAVLGLTGVLTTGLTQIWKTKIVPKFSSEDMAKFWTLIGALVLSIVIATIAYLGNMYLESWEDIVAGATAIWVSAIGIFSLITKALIPVIEYYKKLPK